MSPFLPPLGRARGLAAALFATLSVSAAPLTKGPYLQAPANDGMTIVWEALANEPGTLRFGEGATLNKSIGPISPTPIQSSTQAGSQTFYVYEARLTGLKASTTYRYEASVGRDASGPRQFTTFGRAPERVTFIAYGDSRTNPDKHAAIAAQFPRHQPDFILHTGDLVAKGTQYELWSREFFDPLKAVIDHTPLLPAIGNHEQDGANYRVYFHPLGSTECFYSFDVGPVHVLTLDYRSTKITDEQFRFVEADLKASRAPWKVVLLHYPMFNLGGHATLWGHEEYLPLFRATKVDVVIGGHSHIYERFRLLSPKADPQAWAIQHVTTGGGGAPLANFVADPSLAQGGALFHFLVCEATRTQFTGRCIDIDGKEADTFTLQKQNGRQAGPLLANLYAEETVVAANKKIPRKPSKKEK